jgi:hypothetical protein
MNVLAWNDSCLVLEPFVRKNIQLDELLIGEILDFSRLTCPNLAKTWFRFADWAYAWGRQLLARSAPYKIYLSEFPTSFFLSFLDYLHPISNLKFGQCSHRFVQPLIKNRQSLFYLSGRFLR